MSRLIRLALLLSLILLVVAAMPPPQSAAHGIDGDTWLSWSQDSRQLYLLGFLHAYRLGFAEACLAAARVAEPKWTIKEISACRDRQMSFSRDPSELNKATTDFYRQYPEDRTLELDVLLRQFSDQKHRSAQEIHTLLQAKQPL